MKIRKMPIKALLYLLIPSGAALAQLSSKNPAVVEKLYASGLYRFIGPVLSKATGLFPFSIAELIVVLVPIAFLIYTVGALRRTVSRRGIHMMPFIKYISNIIVIAGILLISFLGLWGLNYYRMPFASIAGLEVMPASVKELESLCRSLVARANDLRTKVDTNKEGIMDIPGDNRDILNNCYKGYQAISARYPELSGSYGNPKPVLLSELMSYTGICGIYFPFTGEANVNIDIPDCSLPSTASHEMAHQRGFAREDEANFISYLACTAHPDVNFKYSGVLLALTNSMNALHQSDEDLYLKLAENYSEGVLRDLEAINEYWDKYEGPVERTSNRINNAYLKANKQKDGVRSYGRMVDLLIAEHRQITVPGT